MSIPLVGILVIFAAIFLVFCASAAVNIFHIARYGTFDIRNATLVGVFLLYSLFLVTLSATYFLSVDWTQTISIAAPAVQLPAL